jgi:hypothetical protein
MPKGITFSIGLFSIIVAAGILLALTRLLGKTVNCPGATPKLHMVIALLVTCWAILVFLLVEAA